MTRAKSGIVSKKRHSKILKLAKGYRGRSKNCFRIAIQKVEKALQYAYRDRRKKKSSFRSLWIQRINASVRENGLTYSKFIDLLKKSSVTINRKSCSEMAINNPEHFQQLIENISHNKQK